MNNKKILLDRLKLPLIGSPMYIVSGPDLVIEQCKAGIIGSFPALNARPKEILDDWLIRISEELSAFNFSKPNTIFPPYAVNLFVNRNNDRLRFSE